MKNDLSAEQLQQPVDVTLPLGVLLKLAEPSPAVVVSTRLRELQADRPRIGEQGLYGRYVGVARADADLGDHLLEALAEAPEAMSWNDAMKWAESIGGTLPTRKEQALLFANVPELFKQEAYWSCEPDAGDESYAWCQTFSYGTQDIYRKLNELRARAVRRIAI